MARFSQREPGVLRPTSALACWRSAPSRGVRLSDHPERQRHQGAASVGGPLPDGASEFAARGRPGVEARRPRPRVRRATATSGPFTELARTLTSASPSPRLGDRAGRARARRGAEAVNGHGLRRVLLLALGVQVTDPSCHSSPRPGARAAIQAFVIFRCLWLAGAFRRPGPPECRRVPACPRQVRRRGRMIVLRPGPRPGCRDAGHSCPGLGVAPAVGVEENIRRSAPG